MRVLLLEDDPMLGPNLLKGLALEGFTPELVTTLEQARQALSGTHHFDAAVFDVSLPDGSAITLLPWLRQQCRSDLPVLLLTARNNASAKVEALDLGADDYVAKPFDLKELAARLRAILRRRHGQTDSVLRAKGFTLNVAGGLLTLENGETYRPPAQELKLITLLMQRPGKVVSKERIEEELYGWSDGAESNIVEVAVYNLRRRLGKQAIITLRGVGYMVAP